jgi:hypothetical protein
VIGVQAKRALDPLPTPSAVVIWRTKMRGRRCRNCDAVHTVHETGEMYGADSQAGMGAASPPELAAGVSEAGGFGMLGTPRGGLNRSTLAALLDRTRELTSRLFGVNFIVRPGSIAARSPREFVEQAAKVGRVVRT